ncbi:hypothetical protein LZ32DRAFT_619680 [Colletotrichum eremochloae]|nr:hypothetical protein LZ32DRAFT_619680 [Colletotrichum eremochloae]
MECIECADFDVYRSFLMTQKHVEEYHWIPLAGWTRNSGMGDIELGHRRFTPSPTRSPSLAAENRPGPAIEAPQPRKLEFTDAQKTRLLETLCPRLHVNSFVLEQWDEHFRNLTKLIYSPRWFPEASTRGPHIGGTVDAITSAINLARRHPTETWPTIAEQLRPLQEI